VSVAAAAARRAASPAATVSRAAILTAATLALASCSGHRVEVADDPARDSASEKLPAASPSAASPPSVPEDRVPPFSWDTVPVYVHLGKSSGPLTDDEVRFLAGLSDFVCLEKGHGRGRFGSTEKGIAHDAKRLKAANPRMKVLFYWNTFLNYHLYDAAATVDAHPEWLFRDRRGAPIYKTGKLEQYNLLDPGFRGWWASVAGRAVTEHGCDGIFMDAVDQAKRRAWMKRGWGEGREPELTRAACDMMDRARRAMGGGGILLYDGIRSKDGAERTTGEEYLPHADGVNVEHFAAFGSRSAESIARDIAAIARAGLAGKIVTVKGWPGPDLSWRNAEWMKLPPDERAEEARRKITFPLACFLVAARERSYFCYSWGYREGHGGLVDYPELRRPLGEPEGDAMSEGRVYTRSFARASVRVDISTREARIDWR
jgi:hypothetical protein